MQRQRHDGIHSKSAVVPMVGAGYAATITTNASSDHYYDAAANRVHVEPGLTVAATVPTSSFNYSITNLKNLIKAGVAAGTGSIS